MKAISQLLLLSLLLLAACTGSDGASQQALVATDTLAPIVSMTPRFTATPVPSRTPLPTETSTPSNTPISPTPSNTPTPSATPPITGIVASLQTVNVREGPGVSFSAIMALTPGTGVQVIATDPDGRWINIRLEDGREGWIAADLLRINPTPTLIPSATPSPDLTLIALGTPFPTAILGGGTITPTPPRSVVTPSPVGTRDSLSLPVTGTLAPPPLPVVDLTAIQETALALNLPTATASFTPLPAISPTPSVPFVGITFTPAPGEVTSAPARVVDIGALCDDPRYGMARPTNITSTTQLDIFWAWLATTPELIDQHIAAVTYEIALNGVVLDNLRNWRQFGLATRQVSGQYAKFWYVPIGTLTPGDYVVTYRATWSRAISDGLTTWGPGTANEEERGSCTFTVR